MQTEEIFLKAPTPFMQAHWHKLLPDWKTAPQVMVIVLLKAKYALEGEGENISQEKERLAARMTILGGEFYRICHQYVIIISILIDAYVCHEPPINESALIILTILCLFITKISGSQSP